MLSLCAWHSAVHPHEKPGSGKGKVGYNHGSMEEQKNGQRIVLMPKPQPICLPIQPRVLDPGSMSATVSERHFSTSGGKGIGVKNIPMQPKIGLLLVNRSSEWARTASRIAIRRYLPDSGGGAGAAPMIACS